MSYNPDDEFIDCWFIIYENSKQNYKEIVAWSRDKKLIKFYLDFHKSKNLVAKKLSDYKHNIVEICNAHINEEIQIGPLVTNLKGKPVIIMVPLTQLDSTQVTDFTSGFNEIEINYAMLHQLIPRLKNKYQTALRTILINEIIEAVIFPKQNLRVSKILFDQIVLLHRLTIDLF